MNNKRNTMRDLTSDESKVITKNLIFLKEELEYKEGVELAKVQFILDTAELSVKRQIKDKEKEKKVLVSEIDEYNTTIEELNRQLKEGVKIKNDKK